MKHLPAAYTFLLSAVASQQRPKALVRLTEGFAIELFRRIPVDSLAKTFQDAIIITRNLRFKYIWIDSLCIIQNDISDWISESQIMGNIFAGGALNIIAANAIEWSTGCFFDRNMNIPLGFRIILPNSSDNQENTNYNVVGSYPEYFEEYVTTYDRAWCFQETLLAQKSVYFLPDQLYWQCRHLTANETFWKGMFAPERSLRSEMIRLLNGKAAPTSPVWSKFISNYSRGS
jgi:hypothetical protein